MNVPSAAIGIFAPYSLLTLPSEEYFPNLGPMNIAAAKAQAAPAR